LTKGFTFTSNLTLFVEHHRQGRPKSDVLENNVASIDLSSACERRRNPELLVCRRCGVCSVRSSMRLPPTKQPLGRPGRRRCPSTSAWCSSPVILLQGIRVMAITWIPVAFG
jgi:hypothetical protein